MAGIAMNAFSPTADALIMIDEKEIEKKMQELLDKHNDFRDMVFNVPTMEVQDFIKYMAYKELLNSSTR